MNNKGPNAILDPEGASSGLLCRGGRGIGSPGQEVGDNLGSFWSVEESRKQEAEELGRALL